MDSIDLAIEEAIRSTREFFEPAVRAGIFTVPDPEKHDIIREQVKQLGHALPAESRAAIIKLLEKAPRSRGRPRSWRNLLIVEAAST